MAQPKPKADCVSDQMVQRISKPVETKSALPDFSCTMVFRAIWRTSVSSFWRQSKPFVGQTWFDQGGDRNE
jgi:hypothetical protein